MTVGELKKLLAQYPDSTPIVSLGIAEDSYDADYSTRITAEMFQDGAFAQFLGHLLIMGHTPER